ncbi:MAG: 15-cis-phytoene desaturase [Pseudomonadota bacterium]
MVTPSAPINNNNSAHKQRIAVVGGGISGMACAHYLSRKHEVTLFEAAHRMGGHTATQSVDWQGQVYNVDTGFIVYNDWTYPNFIRLLDELGVQSQATNMGFSVSHLHRDYEYSGANLNTLFAQRKNIFNPQHWQMLVDIMRFNRKATEDFLTDNLSKSEPLRTYLARIGIGQHFIDYYLAPMGSAIWSSSNTEVLDFSAYFFVRFFYNHGLLNVKSRPQWRVLRGGSHSYIKPLLAPVAHCITGTLIQGVKRETDGALINYGNKTQKFDQIVFACHSDEALKILDDTSDEEREILSAITYRQNRVTLHRDTKLLPKRKRTWASWNYLLQEEKEQIPILTYNMNILQQIKAPITFCVTLNADNLISPELIFHDTTFAHPVFSASATQSQNRWGEINGVNNTWFAGAYWFNGFHEDGVVSALRVANSLGVEIPILTNPSNV